MSIRNIPLESIEEAHLQALKDDQVQEGKVIEYKEALPTDSYEDRKKFLAGVSSFANAAGGDLIYGIREENGVPVELCGLPGIDVDAEMLRLDNMIRDCIEPRIFGVYVRPVPLQGAEKVAIIIRVPRSWAAPHMVKLKKHWRFYSRTSAGKYPLDVSELRTLFALSETTTERIRSFRAERLGRIVAEETPVALVKGAKTVLHIIPFGAFDPAAGFDLSSLGRDPDVRQLGPRRRHNFDGFLTHDARQSDEGAKLPFSYCQIFRNGSIEAVEAHLLRPWEDKRLIPSEAYERELLEALPKYLRLQRALGVDPPLFIMLSLLGVSDYTMSVLRDFAFPPFEYVHPIDRDNLLIPEITVESFDADLAGVMRPAFDAVWNAAGWPRSMNYNEAGEWVGRRRR